MRSSRSGKRSPLALVVISNPRAQSAGSVVLRDQPRKLAVRLGAETKVPRLRGVCHARVVCALLQQILCEHIFLLAFAPDVLSDGENLQLPVKTGSAGLLQLVLIVQLFLVEGLRKRKHGERFSIAAETAHLFRHFEVASSPKPVLQTRCIRGPGGASYLGCVAVESKGCGSPPGEPGFLSLSRPVPGLTSRPPTKCNSRCTSRC